MMRFVLFVFAALIFVACETPPGILIPEQAYSLNEIRSAIITIAGKPREVSENQREYFSQYFGRKILGPSDPPFNSETAKERLYTHFWVLGDRRPYDIRVQVISERKELEGYYEYGEDTQLAKKIATELSAKLAQGQDGLNVIDSFRPF